MSPSKIKAPKVVKLISRNKGRLWLRVDKFQKNYYYGYIDSNPISHGITYNQYVKIHESKVVETKQ